MPYGLAGIHFAKPTIVSAPGAEPILAANVKSHMRVSISDDDTEIGWYIETARRAAEEFLGRRLITQTYDWHFDAWPPQNMFRVPYPPLQSITHIKYIDTAGDTQTWSSDEYDVDTDSEPGRVTVAWGESYPSIRGDANSIEVRFICGYGNAGTDVPQDILHALYLLTADAYEFRGTFTERQIYNNQAAHALLWPHRVVEFS